MNVLLDFKLPPEIQALMGNTTGVKKFAGFIQRKYIFTDLEPGLVDKSICTIRSKDSIWKGINDFLYGLFTPTNTEFASIALPKPLHCFYFLARPLSHLKSIWDAVAKKLSGDKS